MPPCAQEHNGFFGLAIGCTVLANLLLFATHANPAVAIGVALARLAFPSASSLGALDAVLALLAAIVAPCVGCVLAALAFRLRASHTSAQFAAILTEAVGVGFVVFALFAATPTGTGANATVGLDLGFFYVALVYAGGYISGAHYNPIVTFAHIWQSDTVDDERSALHYVATHFLSASLCALLGSWLYGASPYAAAAEEIVDLGLVGGLFLYSFALALVHLNVTAAQPGNSFYGVALGFVLYAGLLTFGDAQTAMFNPAVAVGTFLASGAFDSLAAWANLLVLVAVPFVGAAVAKLTFKLTASGSTLAHCITEAIGSFLIVLTLLQVRRPRRGPRAYCPPRPPPPPPRRPPSAADCSRTATRLQAPGSVGLVYVAVTFSGAHVSGAHYNAAITLLRWLLGQADLGHVEASLYVASQLGGASVAGVIAILINGPSATDLLRTSPPEGFTWLSLIVCEGLFSLSLCLVHYAVCIRRLAQRHRRERLHSPQHQPRARSTTLAHPSNPPPHTSHPSFTPLFRRCSRRVALPSASPATASLAWPSALPTAAPTPPSHLSRADSSTRPPLSACGSPKPRARSRCRRRRRHFRTSSPRCWRRCSPSEPSTPTRSSGPSACLRRTGSVRERSRGGQATR